MSPFTRKFGTGSLVKYGESVLYQVKELRPQFQQVVLEGQSGELLILNSSDFSNSVAKGEYQPLYRDEPEAVEMPQRLLSASERNELDRRLEILSQVARLRAEGESWTDIVTTLLNELPGRLPSMRTIQRWYAGSIGCSDPANLAPRFSGRGNRQQLIPELHGIVIDVIEQLYCQSDRFSLASIVLMVNVRGRTVWSGQAPFVGVSRRTISRMLQRYATFERIGQRMSPGALRKALAPALRYLEVEAPYERVEFDATPLNVLATDIEGTVIGKPTLYIIIDCATGCIIAFYLSIQAESQHTFLKLLEMAFHPRDESFLLRYGVEKPLAPCAMWYVMAGDNSAAHHGEAMYRVLRYLGCTVEFTQAAKPQQHPFVERVHGSIKTGLVQMLAGSHISQEKLESDALGRAMTEAKYTLSEIENYVARWICEVYMDRPLDRLTARFGESCSPRKAMEILSKRYPLLPPPTPDSFRDACTNYAVKHVALTTKGIRYQCFEFNSEELQALLKRSPRDCKVEVRSHPLDVSRVSVVCLQDQKVMVTAYNKQKGLPPMSFEDARLIRKQLYKSDGAVSAEDYAQGYAKLINDINQANGDKKVASNRRRARTQDKQVETSKLHEASHVQQRLQTKSEGVAQAAVDLTQLMPAPRRTKE